MHISKCIDFCSIYLYLVFHRLHLSALYQLLMQFVYILRLNSSIFIKTYLQL